MRKPGVGVNSLVALSRNEFAPTRIRYAAVCVLNQIRMHGFMRKIKEKRFRVLLFQEIQRVIVQNISEITVFDFTFTIHVKLRVEVATLALYADPIVNSGSRTVVNAHVPFAEKRGLVTSIVQQARKGDEFVTARAVVRVVRDTVFVRILASEITCPARRTKRRRNERVLKTSAFACDALDVRDFDKGILHSVPAQIVNQDENDVGTGP